MFFFIEGGLILIVSGDKFLASFIIWCRVGIIGFFYVCVYDFKVFKCIFLVYSKESVYF